MLINAMHSHLAAEWIFMRNTGGAPEYIDINDKNRPMALDIEEGSESERQEEEDDDE
jgi:hypothetical protein